MASSLAPATPDNSTRKRNPANRSATLPTALLAQKANESPTIGASEGFETLFVHPNATVVKFTTPASNTSGSPARPRSSAAGLPWSSTTERTVAVGQLEIYSVPGSVSFLRSGPLLHAIMPRSQCWCVDGVSKFAFRVLSDTYYRIDLPGSTEADLQKVEELKVTFSKVLYYERSACPFDRNFSKDLPEMPDVGRRKGRGGGPAKKWKQDRAFSWRPEDGGLGPGSFMDESSSNNGSSLDSSEDDSDETRAAGRTAPILEDNSDEAADGLGNLSMNKPRTSGQKRVLRSFTAPVQPTTPSIMRQIETGVKVDGAVTAIETAEHAANERARANTLSPRSARTRTYQSMPTDMPPSPPDSSAGIPTSDSGAQSSYLHTIATDIVDASEQPAQPIESTAWSSPIADFSFEDPSMSDIQLSDETKEYIREISRRETEQEDTPSLSLPDIELPAREVDETSEHIFLSTARATDEDGAESRSAGTIPTGEPQSRLLAVGILPEDPYAAIQARIQARRSIGGTTSFHPANSKVASTRSSSSSTLSSGSVSSKKSSVSLRSHNSRQQHALATEIVKKACSAFLGPPAHLVAIMLRIAARFANVAFGVDSMFYVATPAGVAKKIPGSFNFDSGISSDDDTSDEDDDFGVPIKNPIKLAQRASQESVSGSHNSTLDELRRNRKIRDVD